MNSAVARNCGTDGAEEADELSELRLSYDEDEFASVLETKMNSNIAAQQKAIREALQNAVTRSKGADLVYEGLYENEFKSQPFDRDCFKRNHLPIVIV